VLLDQDCTTLALGLEQSRRNGENLGSLNRRLKTLSHGAQGMGVEDNKPQSKTFSVVTSRVGFLVGGHKIYKALGCGIYKFIHSVNS
jgi:hypothetical protein